MTRPPSSFGDRLLGWFDHNRRDLPWRGRSDPWHTWVSEVLLQQTRVGAVIEPFQRFMNRYPTPADWATVSDDELLSAWRGLGYYRRARLLREGARAVVERHGGAVPSELAELAALPGVGEYTSGAIASIAFNQPVPAIDGNVERVLARHVGIQIEIKSVRGRRLLRSLVEERMQRERPGDFNQALMDLGATVCVPHGPRCDVCPVRSDCAAAALGQQEDLPRIPPRRPTIAVHAKAVLVHASRGRVLGVRIPPEEVNSGQIELPGPGILVDSEADRHELARALAERFGAAFEIGRALTSIRHSITHHRIVLTVHEATIHGSRPRALQAFRADDPAAPWCTASRKALHSLSSQSAWGR